ncbi:MAG: methyl-accepting chemotaxis protein [Erythrobacter sp.]|uniref:methyl-accepting chemotaxis protein n=1 Tax=Marinobacter alexandrii TaxID=2570351 RepID=UPI00329A497E
MNMMNHPDQGVANELPELADELLSKAEDESTLSYDIDMQDRRSIFDRLAWFRDLRLAGKIQAIFGTFFATGFAIALVLALGLTELWMQNRVGAQLQDGVIASTELRGTTGELRYNTVRFVFGEEAIALERQQDSYAAAQEQVVKISAIVAEHVPELETDLEAIRTNLVDYNTTFSEMRDTLAREGRSERAIELAYDLSAKGDALFEQSRVFATELGKRADEISQNGISYFFAMTTIVSILGVLACVILIVGLGYLTRDFSKKISEITQWMNRLAKNDRNFEVTGHERKDEIGEMAGAIEMFKRSNHKMEIWARERAERVEQQERAQEELDGERKHLEQRRAIFIDEVTKQLESTVGDIVTGVAAASSELQLTATKMASSAEQSSHRTNEVSRSMQEANSGATAAAAASDEFALSIGEISRQASSSSELARLATDATTEADSTISALADSADQVGQIVELIQTIAQRTNLLALNASIEAARGGEAGRGFAVVASEVKELAMQTSRATEQVAEQIRAMQDTTGASVSALRSIAGQVQELETTAVSIASAVDQQSVAGQDLARSIDMAARGTEEVTGHIEDVRELSLSTGAAATQVLNSANELEIQASTLQEQVDDFVKRVRAR